MSENNEDIGHTLDGEKLGIDWVKTWIRVSFGPSVSGLDQIRFVYADFNMGFSTITLFSKLLKC